MAEIRPFRGIRYDVDEIGADQMDDVVTPPYDVIDEAEQSELYERHPHNFVRIDLNRRRDDDDADDNRYTRARRHLMDWLSEGVLRQDDHPALYLHHQTFEVEGLGEVTRRGFLGTIRLAEYDEEVVLPHERTLRGPKEDRLELMKTTECNLSPVFLLYDDEDSVVDSHFEATDRSGGFSVKTEDGILHELWPIYDEEVHAAVSDFFEDESVLIADGHHRYETALAYRAFRREKAAEEDPDAPYEFTMAFFVNYRDPGLVVLPTHRVVHGLKSFDFDVLIEELGERENFHISRVAGGGSPELLKKALADGAKKGPSFLFMAAGKIPALAQFTGSTRRSPIFDDDTPEEVRELDVTILHEGIFDRLLGISKEAQEAKRNLTYLKSTEKALAAAEDPDNQLVVLMNPTPVEQVDEVCRSGGRMPQKSTFFYPKILSGLVINPL